MPDSSPAVSVIVPSYLPGDELFRCLESILRPAAVRDFDLWVVDSSPGDISPALGSLLADPRLHLLHHEQRLYPGAARDLGVRSSGGNVVVFTDCDCTAGPGWLDRLLDGLEKSGCAACGGGVENGTPASTFGTAEYLSEFNVFTPRNPSRRERFVPTCNMALWREDFLTAGGFEPGMEKGSDVALGRRLLDAGKEIAFIPGAFVFHHNRTAARDFLRNQYRLGRGMAVNFLSGNQPYSSWRGNHCKTALLVAGAGPVRLMRVAGRALAHRELPVPRMLAMLPILALGALFFGVGFASAFLGSGVPGY